MLALEQSAEKWPFIAGGGGGGSSDRSDPIPLATGLNIYESKNRGGQLLAVFRFLGGLPVPT